MHVPLVFFDGVHASVSTYMCIYIHTQIELVWGAN